MGQLASGHPAAALHSQSAVLRAAEQVPSVHLTLYHLPCIVLYLPFTFVVHVLL